MKGIDTAFRTKPAVKTIENRLEIEKIGPGGTPWEAKNRNLQLGWPKMLPSGFEEALEASWARLGRPSREPSWSKIEAWRLLFLFEKALV